MAAKSSSTNLIGMLEPYFTKQAPFQLPQTARNLIVQWMPWVNIVIGILLLPAVLVIIGLGSFVGTFAAAAGEVVGLTYWLSMIVLIATIAMLFITFPGLQARKLSAWKLVFWADILYFVYSVVSGLGNPVTLVGNLIGGALSLVIGLYVLFQIKSSYK